MGQSHGRFARALVEQRQRLGLTQEALAAMTGLSARRISELESGRVARPRKSTVTLLADAFGLQGADRDRFRQQAEGLAGEPTPPSAVAQLPADLPVFVGRNDELTQLDALLATARPAPTAVPVATVCGTPGVGKTALAVHWGHRVVDHFPDGQLYVDLRGFDSRSRVVGPAEAVRDFLGALGVAPDRVPQRPEAQAALYRSLLAGRRMLVLLDNARDADQVRPLLPGSPGCLVLVTSRNQLAGLVAVVGAHPLTLDLLSATDARELLARRLGAGRVDTEPAAVDRIIRACAGLPLALAVVAARARQTRFPLAVLAAELERVDERLDALDAGDSATRIRAVFSWSYLALPPPTARLFRLLGLHPGPDLAAAAAASLAGVPVTTARQILAELVRANLLTEHSPGRYACHDLLRAYAADLTRDTDPEEARRAATARLLDHYVRTAGAADRLLYPQRDPPPRDLPPIVDGAQLTDLADERAATDWLTAEHASLLAVTRATGGGHDARFWALAWALDTFLHRCGRWPDLQTIWRAALRAAYRLGDHPRQAVAHRCLAHTQIRLGRLREAQAHLRRALNLYTRMGDRAGEAAARNNLAYLCDRQGHPDEALRHAQWAVVLYGTIGNRPRLAHALNNVGWYHARLGDHAQALDYCWRAVHLHRESGDRSGEANAWDSLGYAHQHLDQHVDAEACYRRAIALFHALHDQYHLAVVHTHLGDMYHAAGDPGAARAAWEEACAIFTELDHPEAATVRARLRGSQPTLRPRLGADRASGTGHRRDEP